jgi:hypothetical protein
MLDVRRRWRGLRKLVQVRHAAGVVHLACRLQRRGHGEHVRRPVVFEETHDRAPDHAMVRTVEVGLGERVPDAVEGRVRQQQASKHRLLRLDECGGNLSDVTLSEIALIALAPPGAA